MAQPPPSLDAAQADILLLAYEALLEAIEALSLATGQPVGELADPASFRATLAVLTAEVAQRHLEAQP